MRRLHSLAAATVLLAAAGLATGCGGGAGDKNKKAYSVTKKEYAETLNGICDTANREIGALGITNSIKSFNDRGDQALDITQTTVNKFESVTPPNELKDVAKRFNDANQKVLHDLQVAVQAAKAGNAQKFAEARQRVQQDGKESNKAAEEIGATHCT